MLDRHPELAAKHVARWLGENRTISKPETPPSPTLTRPEEQ